MAKEIVIQFADKINKYKIEIAKLKYNKKFAYSFTFDDGLLSIYKVAYPLLNGGKISGRFINDEGFDDGGDGSFSNGLYYTDGCGNDIPFTAGIALTSVDKNFNDIHNGKNNTFITWDNIIEMYNSGWNILNHSYSHSTGKGTDYIKEIVLNIDSVINKTGVFMNQFIIPSGDVNYVDYVFKTDTLGVYGGTFTLDPFILLDNKIKLQKFKLKREFLHTPDVTENNIMNKLETLLEKNNKNIFWYNEFTHSCGNDNIWDIGLSFKTFKFYMKYIYQKYGKEGKDNIWFAPLQDVYEYLFVKEYIKMESKKIYDDKVLIKFDDSYINKYKIDKKSLSLLIDTPHTIMNVTTYGIKNSISYNKKLINLEL